MILKPVALSLLRNALSRASAFRQRFSRRFDGDDEGELALRSSNLGDVDMEIADRIGLEYAFGGGLAFDLGQPGDPVALQTPVKRRAGQMREGGLQGIEAVVERQQSMPSEGNEDGLFLP